MTTPRSSKSRGGRRLPGLFGSAGGGLMGLGLGVLVHLLLNPVLENGSSWMGTLHDYLWILLPVLLAAGATAGWRFGARGPATRRRDPALDQGEAG